jgi:hypothetical protein
MLANIKFISSVEHEWKIGREYNNLIQEAHKLKRFADKQ